MAGTNGIVHGKKCVFQVNLGNGFFTIMCAKSFSATLDSELVETTSKGSGVYKEFMYKGLSYRLNLTGLIKVQDANSDPIFFDLVDIQKQFIELPYRAIFRDDANVTKILTGTSLIATHTLTAAAGQLADSSVDLQGTGEYFLYNDVADSCSNTITGLSINGTNYSSGSVFVLPNANDITISITSLGNPLLQIFRYDYEVDNNGKNSAFGSGTLPFTFDTIEFGGYAEGSHTIKITPVCENGIDGSVFTINLTKLGPL